MISSFSAPAAGVVVCADVLKKN